MNTIIAIIPVAVVIVTALFITAMAIIFRSLVCVMFESDEPISETEDLVDATPYEDEEIFR